MTEHPLDAADAARLLHSGQQVGQRVYATIDFRTQALVQAGTALAIFVYVSAFLFLFGGQDATAVTNAAAGGYSFSTTLLLPILVLSFLTLGVRDTLRATLLSRHPSLSITAGLVGIIPFMVVAAASIFGAHYSWWVNPLATLCAAAQPATLALRSARNARTHPAPSVPAGTRVALSTQALTVTVAVGVLFGLAAASGAFRYGAIVGAFVMVLLLVMLALSTTRWGLSAVGAEWGRAQWLGFAASFGLLVGVTVILVRTPFDAPLIGIAGGLTVAAPLALSAIRGSASREGSEGSPDAPAAQS
ncbi:hypothetical protein [Glaciibacter psychrotolerans]|uniref:Uncharacterized protein n=1 Tax=Glaciibacter psychrotolerans TaxID=670054 RepID=A0A7Z0J6L4_9MICO|nr:hypothetical protein [Leifsonia psychrotolerans]NYJ20331.1 hypothetical protein [Leifsonia psychrotolerans]